MKLIDQNGNTINPAISCLKCFSNNSMHLIGLGPTQSFTFNKYVSAGNIHKANFMYVCQNPDCMAKLSTNITQITHIMEEDKMDINKVKKEAQSQITILINALEDMEKQRDMWKEKYFKLDEAFNQNRKDEVKTVFIMKSIQELMVDNSINKDTKQAILEQLAENFNLKSLIQKNHGKVCNLVLLADNSGSMGNWECNITKSFSYWYRELLELIYGKVNVTYIVHHTEAEVVNEQEFFTKGEYGGSISSSGLKIANSEIDLLNYEKDDTFFFYFSDGDNLSSDNEKAGKLMSRISGKVKIAAYVEINQYNRPSTLMSRFGKLNKIKLSISLIKENKDVYDRLSIYTSILKARG